MKAKGIVIGICVLDAALIGLSAFLYTSQDRTVPVISFEEEAPVYTENMDESRLLEGVTAVDDRDGDVSASLLVEKVADTSTGDVIVTYAAMDSSNNVAKVSRVLKTAGGQANLSGTEADNAIESETERESESQSDQDSEDGQGEEDEEPEPEVEDAQQGPEEAGGEEGDQQGQENGQDNNDNAAGGNGRDIADARQADNTRQNDAGNANGQDAAGNAGQENEQNGAGDGQTGNNGQGNEPGIGAEEVQSMENRAPVLTLTSNTLTVSAGSTAVNWEQCIGELSDDTDGRLQLLANLVMDGAVDLNTPGTYPVTIYTRDSQGAESARQTVNVHVE